jgi:hypothetical protein
VGECYFKLPSLQKVPIPPKPNADLVQERNDQVRMLRKAWSSRFFLFSVLRSCKFPPKKPPVLCDGFEITLTNAFDSVFGLQKTGMAVH